MAQPKHRGHEEPEALADSDAHASKSTTPSDAVEDGAVSVGSEAETDDGEQAESLSDNDTGIDASAVVDRAVEEAEVDRLVELEAELAGLKDQLLRALAETENVRRRARRDREEAMKFASAGLAKDMLNVVDNLRRALESVSVEDIDQIELLKNLYQGVELVERELLAAFERQGIERIEPLGEMFNHEFHEAMFEVPDTDQPPGTVVQMLQPGYLLHGRLLRPARVGVAKGRSEEPEEHTVDTTV